MGALKGLLDIVPPTGSVDQGRAVVEELKEGGSWTVVKQRGISSWDEWTRLLVEIGNTRDRMKALRVRWNKDGKILSSANFPVWEKRPT